MVDKQESRIVPIKFGTDGWRAIISDTYTIDNLRRVAEGTAKWMVQRSYQKLVIGHDCRFGGEMFMREAARIFAHHGIQVFAGDCIVSTPMVSLAVLHHHADLGVVITASHNPPLYNGYKLKSSHGSPSLPMDIEEIEALIPDFAAEPTHSFSSYLDDGKIKLVDIQTAYEHHVREGFHLNAIRSSVSLAYDAMYGAGQFVMEKLFPEMKGFHCDWNPGFHGRAPEPIAKNLGEIIEWNKSFPGKYIGIATDGDADRIAMVDPFGKMIDSHHILLLLLYYLAGIKGQKGKIVVSCSVTNKLAKLAAHYGLEFITTKIGFKYIAEYIIEGDVLVGGEESGGLAIAGHIPERDGIWIGLTVLQLMAETKKSLAELIEEIYSIVGAFVYDRIDLHLNSSEISRIAKYLSQPNIEKWGSYKVIKKEQLDGEKYYFENDSWLMFRRSGTEPVLRIYIQGQDSEELKSIQNAVLQELKLNQS